MKDVMYVISKQDSFQTFLWLTGGPGGSLGDSSAWLANHSRQVPNEVSHFRHSDRGYMVFSCLDIDIISLFLMQ